MNSITGYVFLNDMASKRRYAMRVNHTIVEINELNGNYAVLLKMSPNQVESAYIFQELDGVIYHEKNIVMRFRNPRHELLILSNDVNKVKNFYKNLMSLAKNLNLNISNNFQTDIFNIFGIFNNNDMFKNFNVNNLRIITLENCNLPNLPEEIGNLKISSLSLSGSKLNMPNRGRNSTWDWMTKDMISRTLNTLEMNSIGLEKLPYEIINLKKLQTLSMSKNKLNYLPHFIGELSELDALFVDGNRIRFFPDTLSDTVFQKINILNNNFKDFKESRKNECSEFLKMPTLTNLSVLSLMKNFVKFKRQTIPYTLWTCNDIIGRCKLCKKLMILYPQYEHYTFAIPKTTTMIPIEGIYWQYFKCRPFCVL